MPSTATAPSSVTSASCSSTASAWATSGRWKPYRTSRSSTFATRKRALLGDAIGGELIWNAGTRDGAGGTVKKDCKKGGLIDCYIGRFGWIGDRVIARGSGCQRGLRRDEHDHARGIQADLRQRQGHVPAPLSASQLRTGQQEVPRLGRQRQADRDRREPDGRLRALDRRSDSLRSPGRHGRRHRRRESVQAREVRHVPRHREDRHRPSKRHDGDGALSQASGDAHFDTSAPTCPSSPTSGPIC